MIFRLRRTKTYIGTITNDEAGRAELKQLREECAKKNASERTFARHNPGYVPRIRRVKAFGRLGENNPCSQHYKMSARAGFRNPYQYIAMKHAATFDLYTASTSNHW